MQGRCLDARSRPCPQEEYLVGGGAGCPHECHSHAAVTAGGSMCASSLGTAGAQPLH